MFITTTHIVYKCLLGLPILIGVILSALYICRYWQLFREKNQEDATPLSIARTNLKQTFHGCMYYVMAVVVIAPLIIFAAIVWQPEAEIWNDIETFFGNHPVIASILGTMIGLLITFTILKPKLILKKAYIFTTAEEEERLSLCIANWGIFPIHDVQISLFWLREPTRNSKHPNDYAFQNEHKTMRLEVFRPSINSIDGIFSRSNTYSFHGDKPFVEDLQKRDDKNQKWLKKMEITEQEATNGELYGNSILCMVRATHSLSGISKIYEWKIDVTKIDGYKTLKPIEEKNVIHYDLTVEKETGKAELKHSIPTVNRRSTDGQSQGEAKERITKEQKGIKLEII